MILNKAVPASSLVLQMYNLEIIYTMLAPTMSGTASANVGCMYYSDCMHSSSPFEDPLNKFSLICSLALSREFTLMFFDHPKSEFNIGDALEILEGKENHFTEANRIWNFSVLAQYTLYIGVNLLILARHLHHAVFDSCLKTFFFKQAYPDMQFYYVYLVFFKKQNKTKHKTVVFYPYFDSFIMSTVLNCCF